jgi:hypothetical protein
MKKSIISLLIVFCFINGLAAQEQNADALFLKQRKEFVLNADGSMDYTYSHQLKLITYMASDKLFGESFIVYNPAYQKLTIKQAQTTMVSGRKVKSPNNAFNEVLPQFAPNAPAFNHLREMVVTHTGIEPGATIDFAYTVHSRRDFMSTLLGNELLPATAPVRELKIVVKVPASQSLSYHLFNNKAVPVIKREGVFKVYTWTFNNIKALSHEAFQSRDNRLLPRLVFSAGKQTIEKITAQPAFALKANEAMKAAVETIKAKETDPLKIALSLQELVVGDLTTISVPPVYTGFRLRTPVEVWNTGYGTEPEKALLFAALLKQAGINSFVSAAEFTGFMDGQPANPLLFTEYYVLADFGKIGMIALSPIRIYDQNPLVSQPNRELAILIPGKGLKTVKIEPEQNLLHLHALLTVGNNGKTTGLCNASWTGILQPYLRITRSEKAVSGLFTAGIGLQDIKKYEVTDNQPLLLKVEYKLDMSEALRESNGLFYLVLPQLNGDAASSGFSELPATRTESLELPAVTVQEYNMAVTLPATYSFISPDLNKNLKNSAGSVEISFKKEGQSIEVNRKLSLSTLVLKPEQVSDLKALMNIWLNKNYKQLILKKI